MTELAPGDLDTLIAAVDEALMDPSHDPAEVYAELGLPDLVPSLARPAPALCAALAAIARRRGPGPVIEELFVRPWLMTRFGARLSGGSLALADQSATEQWRAVRGEVRLSRGRLTGTISGVAYADTASELVVVTASEDGEAVVVIAADAPGVRVRTATGLDPAVPISNVDLAGCAADVVSADPAAARELRAWLRLLIGAQLVGIADEVVGMTRAHVTARHQFGQAIAGFQAVRHTLADMAVHSIALRNLVADAAQRWDAMNADTRDQLAQTVKAYAGEAATRICEQGLQLHGGIGFVTEYPLHLYFKAALRLRAHYGAPGELHADLGRALLDAR